MRVRCWWRARCLAAVGVVTACSGGGGETPTGRVLTLAEVARYGWESDRPGGHPELPAEAGVLGRIVNVVQGPDSTLYVLDQGARKIVAFAPAGDVRRVIPVLEGDGPGEVRTPVDLAMTSTGDLAILDHAGRIVLADPQGTERRSVRIELPGALRIVTTPDTFWITRGAEPGSTATSLHIFAPEGRLLGSFPDPGPEARTFGSGVAVATAPDGSVLEARVRPGLWRRHRGGESFDEGMELGPGLDPPTVTVGSDGTRRTEGPLSFNWGIGALPDGSVLLTHLTLPSGDGDPPEMTLSVFAPSGDLLGQVKLPQPSTVLRVSPVTGHVIVASMDPYPAVVEYRIGGIAVASP